MNVEPTERVATLLGMIALAMVGCDGPSAVTCEDGGACAVSCSTDDQCLTEVCDVAAGACVQCTPTRAEACMAATPVCGGDNRCTGCTSHAQCTDSDVCLPDGSCAETTEVAYVSPRGSDQIYCTKAVPCLIVSKALATNRRFVKFTGTTNENVLVKDRVVTFLADPGAKLTSTTAGTLLRMEGFSTLTIYDLEISGSSGTYAHGINVGTTGSLILTRVKVLNNQGTGINAGALTVSQSTIVGNRGGGISAGAVFDITNNFVVGNGDADMSMGSNFGGIQLSTSVSGASRLEFNTVVYNHARPGTLSSAGIACSGPGFVASGNIISSNNEGTTFAAQTKGSCTYGNSYTAPGSAANTLGFASPTSNPPDLHLTSASPSSIVDAAGTCDVTDIDGDTRPVGGACDLGADELKP